MQSFRTNGSSQTSNETRRQQSPSLKERDLNMNVNKMKTLAGLTALGLISAVSAQQTIRPSGGDVQTLRVRGRVQTQFGYVDAKNDEGSSDYSTFEIRRARIGLRGDFQNNIRGEVEANVVPGSDFSVSSAYIQWREHKAATVLVGYVKPFTSIEENTSSASILTVERSLVNNTIAAPGESTGLQVAGDLGTLFYGVGLHTDQANTNTANESAKYMYNLHGGIKLDGMAGEGSKLRIQGSFLSSDDEAGNLAYEEVIVFGVHFAQGGFDLRAEYFIGDTDGVETSGFYIMPSLMLSEKLQGVVRYEQSESDKSTGLRAASRYVRRTDGLAVREDKDTGSKFDPQRGDEHMALYLGLNYYLQGDGSKLMLGVEFAELDNTKAGTLESTSVFTAWRVLF